MRYILSKIKKPELGFWCLMLVALGGGNCRFLPD